MAEDIWELVNGPVADRIEALNRVSQTSFMNALVLSLLVRPAEAGPPIPDESALRQLHCAATRFLLIRPGRYRDCEVHTEEDGAVIFRGQPHQDIRRLVRRFFSDLKVLWKRGDALDVAAFALWRINWIHPFVNGNGRTAITFTYACLCLKLGALLPRQEIFIDGVTADRAAYLGGLRVANRSVAVPGGQLDLSAVKRYLDSILLRQVQAARVDSDGLAPGYGAPAP